MNNQNETLGLRVLSVSPSHLESNVNVNSTIDVTFTSDINPSTLTKNIVVFEDYNKVYKNAESLKDYSQYTVVKGSISYNDKVLTYTPEKPFNTGSSYILVLNDKITDITGNKLIQKYINVFYTESVASYGRCEITNPKYGYITDTVPTFSWVNQKSPSYIFQMSKIKTFEVLITEDVVPGNEYEDEISYTPFFDKLLQEGMYFIRVKSENGEWSDIHQIFIKPITDAVIAQEDTPEMLSYSDFFENLLDPIVVLEQFPAPNSINNSLKTNMFYIKIKGKLDESRVNLDDSFVYGESLDENHEEYAHTEITGSWSIVYDSYYDVTYIIFTPGLLNPEEEEEEPEDEPIEPTDEPTEPTDEPTGEPIESEPTEPTTEPVDEPIIEPTEPTEPEEPINTEEPTENT